MKILVVDGLEADGHTTLEAADGVEALQILAVKGS